MEGIWENSDIPNVVVGTAIAISTWCIAIASAFLWYRENYGHRPLLLIVRRGYSGEIRGEAGFVSTDVHCTFELWNRRKYPIVLRAVSVEFPGLNIDASKRTLNAGWHQKDGVSFLDGGEAISPSSNLSKNVEVPLLHTSGARRYKICVRASVFDPVSAKVRTLCHTLEVNDP